MTVAPSLSSLLERNASYRFFSSARSDWQVWQWVCCTSNWSVKFNWQCSMRKASSLSPAQLECECKAGAPPKPDISANGTKTQTFFLCFNLVDRIPLCSVLDCYQCGRSCFGFQAASNVPSSVLVFTLCLSVIWRKVCVLHEEHSLPGKMVLWFLDNVMPYNVMQGNLMKCKLVCMYMNAWYCMWILNSISLNRVSSVSWLHTGEDIAGQPSQAS